MFLESIILGLFNLSNERVKFESSQAGDDLVVVEFKIRQIFEFDRGVEHDAGEI